MRRFNPRKLAFIGVVILLIAVFVAWFYFRNNHSDELCTEVVVKIYPGEDIYFISRSQVLEMLKDSVNRSPVGQPLKHLNLKYLEQRLKRNKMIANANVYSHLNGRLVAEVWQKIPIIRLIDDGYSYYLDIDGKEFPASRHYTARVMVGTGKLDSSAVKKLYTVAAYVQEKPFWKAMIEQIFVNELHDLVLIPAVGNFELVLGDTERLEEKLNDLEVFLKNGLTADGWSNYKSVSVKYRNILVCK